ncbi:GAF domain-containing protein [Cytophagaceae bacterium DM2B3-1]|uniref:GAF domain-containing protein n=1 Tax=Xanthocytophaga flava TaxID=3048013 RepID=A0ABT7CTW6_9BACT|nr:GAF domain-containing protein [Xanthocytophaga flavus]MDJ1496387.1 GAF domain-containing protein [Xanthocytophaga flavus]
MNVLTIITSTGVKATQTEYIQDKIRISNSVALIGFVASFVNVLVTYNHSDVLRNGYIVNSVFFAVIVALNAFGFYSFSRIMTCLFTSISTTLLYILLQPSNGEYITGLIIVMVIITIIPWLLFDLSERWKLTFTLSIHIICLLCIHIGGDWIETGVDYSFIQTSEQIFLYAFTSIMVLSAGLYVLQKSHQNTITNSSKLIDTMQSQQLLLQEKEEKLNSYVKEVEENQRINQQRQWVSDGLAMFADILRKESNDTVHLYEILISKLVKYINANQGGLFLVQSENTQDAFIELIACYAYERKKYLKKRLEIGEGLVGQAVQEIDTLYLTDLPQDYIQITSGLGKANPTCLTIIPLKVNDKVEGVLEIASFEEIPLYQREFLEKIGESIASTIATTRINERTKQLLEASQWQTEQMRSQEEEMRQNMEELAATQEEMERKTREMEELYAQSKVRESDLVNSLELLEITRREMETKQLEIEQLLHEAHRNEEQLRQQEETLLATLEEIQLTKEELQIKNGEIERTKQEEKARADALIESQKKIMQKVLDKQKIKESEMQQKINTLQQEVEMHKNKLS